MGTSLQGREHGLDGEKEYDGSNEYIEIMLKQYFYIGSI
jgi:hypothetical protein